MAFFDDRFPDEIAQGATGGPVWKTEVNEANAGQSFRNRDWSRAKHRFEVSQAIKTLANFEKVRAFFYVVGGRGDAFRFKDYSNFKVAQAIGALTLISGAIYQMNKAEVYGSRTYLRRITKPVSGSITVWRTRSASTTTITPSIDYLTGQVTVSGHVSGDTYAWAGQFDVPCMFGSDSMETVQWIGPDSGMMMSWPSIPVVEDPDA